MRMIVFSVMLLLVTGCAVSYQAVESDEMGIQASTQINHIKKDGFCIAARELNERESKNFLGLNVKEEGYIPYSVDFENNSETGFIVKKNRVKMISEQGDEIDPAPIEDVLNACRYSHMRVLPWWIIIIPGIFIAIDEHQSISLANELMEKDYREKSFRKDGYLVNPKDMAHGVLFFKKPPKGNAYSHLLFRVEQLGETEEKFTELIEFKVSISD